MTKKFMNNKKAVNALLCTISLGALITGNSFAQEEAKDEFILEEIIVTATKRSTSLQSTPLSISAVTGDKLEKMGASSFSDYYRSVPGLFVMDRGPHEKKFVIRGIQNDVIRGGGTVGIYINDMPVSLSSGQPDLNLFDIDRVEVLRGPQGTLYGASSMAGTIKYITKKPNTSEVEGKIRGDISIIKNGEAGYAIEGMFNLPIVKDKFAVRGVVYKRKQGGYIDRVYEGETIPAFAGVPEGAFFAGSPAVRGHDAYVLPSIIEKNANDHNIKGGRLSGRLLANDNLMITASLLYEESELDERFNHQPDKVGDLENALEIRQPLSQEILVLNLAVEYDFGWSTLYSSSNYFSSDTNRNGTFYHFFPADLTTVGTELTYIDEGKMFAQEVRLVSSGENKLNWIAGAWYLDGKNNSHQDIRLQSSPENTLVYDGDTPSRDKQWALFGELSYDLTEKFTTTFGIRYWDVSRTSGPAVNNIDPVIFFLSPKGSDNTVNKFDDTVTTLKFNLSYQVTDDVLLYTQAAEGFRVGGFNLNESNNPAVPDSYGSDSLWNYEAGAKFTALNGRAVINLAGYYIKWKDIQTRVFVNGAGFNGNAGAAHIAGLEFSGNYYVTNSLTFSLNGSILEAKLDEDAPIDPDFPTGLEGKKGNRLPGVPNITLASSLQYDFQINDSMEGSFRVDANYTGSSFTKFRAEAPADPESNEKLDSYAIVNARTSIYWKDWQFSLYANNIFDKRAQLDIFNSLDQPRLVNPNQPRKIGLSVQKKF